jgi:peptidoglycan biosynthesis protein MviN/MurJ (putative lipid II flippase)
MNTYIWSLLAIGLSLSSWLCVRLGYTFLPPSWDDKPFWIGFLLYLAALIVSALAVIRAFAYAGLATTGGWQGLLAVVVALAAGLLAIFSFVLVYGEGMQGYADR